jgi:hypothetical protein
LTSSNTSGMSTRSSVVALTTTIGTRRARARENSLRSSASGRWEVCLENA